MDELPEVLQTISLRASTKNWFRKVRTTLKEKLGEDKIKTDDDTMRELLKKSGVKP